MRRRTRSRTRRPAEADVSDDIDPEILRISKEMAEGEEAKRFELDFALIQSVAAAAAPPKKRPTATMNLDAFIHPLIQRKVRIARTIPNNPEITELRPEGLAEYRTAMIRYWLQPNVVLDPQSRSSLVKFFPE